MLAPEEGPMQASQLMQARHEAVRATLARVRAIAPRPEVTRADLEKIKSELIALATRSELFPPQQFAVAPGKTGAIFELAVDEDLRYALYASAGAGGKAQPPHNHTTWAAISGVYGEEHNVAYERVDDRSVPGEGRLEKRWELTCRRGNAVAFLPDDFHTIEVKGDAPSLHLHLYGRSLADLPGRVFFPGPQGGKYQRFMAHPVFVAPYVDAPALRAMLEDGEELAILDVREGGVFARSHLLAASNVPLSRLELMAPMLLPRKDVRIVLADDDQSLAQRAAAVLRRHGYLNLAVLAGGVAAWGAAGYELFSGTNVPSKAFGELVEHAQDTPRIDAEVLKRWQDEGRDVVVLDSRPMDEYRMMSIPGAMDCPGAELVYRVPALLKSPQATVVVNCAGRTRSIIGAQSLRNAGLKNPVVALKNGTMGWHLAGFQVVKGKANLAPAPQGEALAAAQALAREVAERYGVQFVDRASLERMRGERSRTTYVFDVRLPEDYAAGHLTGSLNAPGGQLVQATDTYAAVRNARVVLVDRDAVQAVMTAHWLGQMGWTEVHVLRDGLAGALETGTGAVPGLGEAALDARSISPAALKEALARGGVEAIDVGESLRYRKARIPGAWYAMRSRLAECLARFAKDAPLAFVCADGRLSRYAAQDALALGYSRACYLAGGAAAWNQAGFATEKPLADGDPRLLTATEDVWYRPYDRARGVEEAMQQYLTWEVNLLAQLEREPYMRFDVRPR
jgi:rhodanese-related sulfurtransferase/predicted metal-dependent enzyme (double-stranded beta helix superfamily)